MYQGQRIVAVVQARMGSRRLPGKVLMPLRDRPVLWHIIQRIKSLEIIDQVIVATSTRTEDDDIVDFLEWLKDPKITAFRGPHEDVLSRFYMALSEDMSKAPDVVVRITGDNPLVSTGHLQKMIELLVDEDLDGVDAHREHTGLTLGFGSEVYRFQALVDAHLLAVDPTEREHVSLFIKRRPHAFEVAYPTPDPALCSDLRLTMDFREDYDLLNEIYRAFFRTGELIDCRRVLEWLRSRPDLVARNYHHSMDSQGGEDSGSSAAE